jgi:hypothetical protein
MHVERYAKSLTPLMGKGMSESRERSSLEIARLRVERQRQVIRQLRAEGKDIGAAQRVLETYLEIVRTLTSK